MSNKEKEITVYIDTIPNLLNHPTIGKQQQKEVGQLIHDQFESKLDDIVTRYASLPVLLIHHGEYCNLLMEARELFINGYFYSCVAMCGTTAERILKDVFAKSLLVASNGQPKPLNDEVIKDISFFSAKNICEFLVDAGVLDRKLRTSFKSLGELRNKYAHAGGKKPEEDARKAIGRLHSILEGTVSIFKDFNIKAGKLVSKQTNAV